MYSQFFSEYQSLLQECEIELDEKNRSLGVERIVQWSFDKESGSLSLYSEDGDEAVFRGQIIGSLLVNKQWIWGWDHPLVQKPFACDSNALKWFGESHGIEFLTKSGWIAEHQDAWAVTALAVHVCDSVGGYFGKSGENTVYFSIRAG